MWFLLLSVYVLGFLCGVIAIMLVGFFQLKKIKKARELFLADLEKKAKEAEQKLTTIKERMDRVKDITKLQLEMLARMDEPSKNALHSKYKNDLNLEIREMEKEKNDILKSILKDGYDPTLTILNPNNERESVKLSEYLARAGVNTSEIASPDPTDPNAKKVGRFVVYNGGNDDTSH